MYRGLILSGTWPTTTVLAPPSGLPVGFGPPSEDGPMPGFPRGWVGLPRGRERGCLRGMAIIGVSAWCLDVFGVGAPRE